MATDPGTAFTYQGQITSGGSPVDTPVSVDFALFDAATLGNQIGGTLNRTVTPAEGVFSVNDLDFGTSPYADNQSLWLELTIEGDVLPRQELTPTPFALNTRGITVDGDRKVGLGTTTPSSRLEVIGSAVDDGQIAQFTNFLDNAQLRIAGEAGGAAIQAWDGNADSPAGLTLQGSGGTARIGPASNETLPSIFRIFETTDFGGITIQTDDNNHNTGVFFRNSGANYTWAFMRAPNGTNGNNADFIIAGGDGNKHKGGQTERIRFEYEGGIAINSTSTQNSQLNVLAADNSSFAMTADNPATTGSNDGARILSSSPDGNALTATNRATTGAAFGIVGETASTDALAMGVRGVVPSNGSGYGVYGEAASASGYGVFSNGRFAATGTKSFVIDHPLDPANRLLVHYSMESDEVLNTYSGSVILDNAGAAWVELPVYWESINADPRYQLTPIGAPAPSLHIASEVHNGAFRIAGGVPGQKVSWTVTARRDDPFVAQLGAPVEVEKIGAQRGRFLQPMLFGLPEQMGMHHAPTRSAATPVGR